MLIREGDQRSLGIDIRLAILLSGVAGSINAAGFQATGYFSANQTGNVSALSDYTAIGQASVAALFGLLVIAFVGGALCSGLLIERGRRTGMASIYAVNIAVEGVLLLMVGLALIVLPFVNGIPLVICLSFAMGMQNATTSRISQARVRTTHVSGMATDIGLGLASLIVPSPESPQAIARLKLYAATIVSFVGGGIAGVAIYTFAGGFLFIAAATALFAIALPAIRRARSMKLTTAA